MRPIDEIEAEIEQVRKWKTADHSGYLHKMNQLDELNDELRLAITHDIPFDDLEKYCDAIRDGRCVVLPCKVGDTVYRINCGKINKFTVGSIYAFSNGWSIWAKNNQGTASFSDFGKTVFLTREEAEKAREAE